MSDESDDAKDEAAYLEMRTQEEAMIAALQACPCERCKPVGDAFRTAVEGRERTTMLLGFIVTALSNFAVDKGATPDEVEEVALRARLAYEQHVRRIIKRAGSPEAPS